ncbi:MAG: efflux RND transporter periplasmic adaptor subunit [Moorea sp. SIO3I7]|uniref:Efflux transporter periplasmic adaptor subunit n=1 Tax=Moorena bouillonii PNG TaxID=568701 RepID=A0A1U7N4A0_9CYAN|nr:efflux RND transporter periplasmic adaptor subunit [Moorena bouillonii]NEO00483.1 efflux RND transporter periplasmic adaptor subunit [Moorena sp. SIO3I7]NEO46348.1 efflux RND transporter periplasmic adaptor subunit [Moorena sp. SIO4A3]OLT60744.1 efflux transporter periplasmic adaptor subunit [Moorena bouillonii PNG]
MTRNTLDERRSQLNGSGTITQPDHQQKSQLNGSGTTITQPDQQPLHQANHQQEDSASSLPSSGTSESQNSLTSGAGSLVMAMSMGIMLTFLGMRLIGTAPKVQKTDSPAETAETPAAVASAETPAAVPSAVPAQTVTVAEVKTTTVNRTLEAIGSVAAFEEIRVKSQATGLQIKQVLVREGEFVKAGQVMVRLDNAVLQAQLAQAQAAVAQAEARLAELKAGTRSEEKAQARARLDQAQARLRQAQASIPRQIDQAKAQVASAEAQLSLAKRRFESQKKLIAEGAISQDRYNEVESQYFSAQANLSEAQQRLEQARNTNSPEIAQLEAAVVEAQQQLQQRLAGSRPEVIAQAQAQLAREKAQVQLVMARLNDTQVVAPVSGKVATRNARVGDITSSSETLFTIIEKGRLELLLRVPETQLSQIQIGQPVEISSKGDSSLKLSGTVREIDPIVDQQSRQALVKVDLPNSGSLLPGMFLRGSITISSTTGLTIPSKAVLPQPDTSAIVYRLEADNTVKAQPVVMGELLPSGQVEINSGLSPSDRIVLKGAAFLKDGDRVQVLETQ